MPYCYTDSVLPLSLKTIPRMASHATPSLLSARNVVLDLSALVIFCAAELLARMHTLALGTARTDRGYRLNVHVQAANLACP
jgi:hypothetical protein